MIYNHPIGSIYHLYIYIPLILLVGYGHQPNEVEGLLYPFFFGGGGDLGHQRLGKDLTTTDFRVSQRFGEI